MAKQTPITKNPNYTDIKRRAFAVKLSDEELEKVRYIMTVHNLQDFSKTIRFLIHRECARLEGIENE